MTRYGVSSWDTEKVLELNSGDELYVPQWLKLFYHNEEKPLGVICIHHLSARQEGQKGCAGGTRGGGREEPAVYT